MAIQLEEIRARLTADTAQYQTAMRAAGGSMQAFSGRLPGASRGLNTIKSAMSHLAFQAAGIPGPIGKISTALLGMTAGSGLVLGVVAGLGAIALAYNALTKGAREAAKATEELITAQLKQRDANRTIAIRQDEDLARLRAEVEVRRNLFRASEALAAALGPMGVESITHRTRNQDALNRALMAYNDLLRASLGLETAADREKRLKDEAKAAREAAAAFRALRAEIKATDLRVESLEQIRKAYKSQKFGASPIVDKDEFARTMRDVQAELAKSLDDKKAQAGFHRIGETVGHILAEGVMDGFRDMQSVLRSIFATVLNVAIGYVTGGIPGALAGAGKAAAAAAEGKGSGTMSGSIIGPASMNLNVNTGKLPAPSSPFDVARDSHWQRVLRESALVAQSAGFSFR